MTCRDHDFSVALTFQWDNLALTRALSPTFSEILAGKKCAPPLASAARGGNPFGPVLGNLDTGYGG